jgi:hypothetical protein
MENALAERRFVAALQTGVQDGMDWTITTQAFAAPIPNAIFDWEPMKVRVDVTWPFRGGTQTVSLTTVTLFHKN